MCYLTLVEFTLHKVCTGKVMVQQLTKRGQEWCKLRIDTRNILPVNGIADVTGTWQATA